MAKDEDEEDAFVNAAMESAAEKPAIKAACINTGSSSSVEVSRH